jgi:hypothetical protein
MGFIGYVTKPKFADGWSPYVIEVTEPAGSQEILLHSADGRTWARSGLTVFETEDEARDDALKRLAAEGQGGGGHGEGI